MSLRKTATWDAQLTSFLCLMEKEHLCVQFPHWSVPFLVSDRMSQTRIQTCVCVVVGAKHRAEGDVGSSVTLLLSRDLPAPPAANISLFLH